METAHSLVAASAHHRFAELRRLIPGITEKVLTQQLRELEADGIVNRRVFATIPPKVEYSLTEYGKSLKQALNAICEWGQLHMQRIGAAEKSPSLRLKTNASTRQAANQRT
jgi:DNA-binding HxlR family transcriptional regulator